ncbi:MAG: ABC transporter ATP-binding protein [Candidatus Rokuibacteriota bacterium]
MRFEIRRPHEALQITMLYVTHDQAEAMVTSDRIAVMREGRVEQVGTARAIYERPATAFVAGFIGRTNLLRGTLEADRVLRLPGGLALRIADTCGLQPGDEAAVSIRPHRLIVAARAVDATGAGDPACNLVAGMVTRAVYFGDVLDVQVALSDGGPVVRLSALPEAGLAVGQPVTLAIPPEACVILPPA